MTVCEEYDNRIRSFGRKNWNEFLSSVEFPESAEVLPDQHVIFELTHKRLLTKAHKRQFRFNCKDKLT